MVHPLVPKWYRLIWHVAHVPKLDCTEVVHPLVPKWSCTELVLTHINQYVAQIRNIKVFVGQILSPFIKQWQL